MASISGLWIFKHASSMDFSGADIEQVVNFSSYNYGTINCHKMTKIFNDDDDLYEIHYYGDGGNIYALYGEPGAPGSESWSSPEIRTVDFGISPQAVSQTFYDWFTANAVGQVTTLTFTPYYQGEEKTATITSNGDTTITATSGKAMTSVVVTTNVPTNEGDPIIVTSESELEALDTNDNVGKIALYDSQYYVVEDAEI